LPATRVKTQGPMVTASLHMHHDSGLTTHTHVARAKVQKLRLSRVTHDPHVSITTRSLLGFIIVAC